MKACYVDADATPTHGEQNHGVWMNIGNTGVQRVSWLSARSSRSLWSLGHEWAHPPVEDDEDCHTLKSGGSEHARVSVPVNLDV